MIDAGPVVAFCLAMVMAGFVQHLGQALGLWL